MTIDSYEKAGIILGRISQLKALKKRMEEHPKAGVGMIDSRGSYFEVTEFVKPHELSDMYISRIQELIDTLQNEFNSL